MNKKLAESFFNIAGFKILYIEEIKNSYWPFIKEYFEYILINLSQKLYSYHSGACES
jgi:hypothetical protein